MNKTMLATNNVGGLPDGVIIILFILSVIVAGVLIFFLIKGIQRDRRKRLQEKEFDGALNATRFDAMMKQHFSKVTRFSHFTLMTVAINDAKAMLDNFGETQYNNAIKVVIGRLEKLYPMGTKICQYSYDTLKIFISESRTDEELRALAMYTIVECNKTVNMIANLLVEFNVNVAIVSYNEFNKTYEQMQQNLDLTLIASKRSGINQVTFHTVEINNHETEEYKFYEEIKDAIEHNEFVLYYQPIVNLVTSDTIGFESLIRWNHRTMGILPPSKFLNIIDQSGDINWVGIWSFEQLLLQYTEWKRRNPNTQLLMSFNLSPKQLMNEKLVDEMRQVLRKYKINTADICMEVVEFALFEKMSVIKDNITKLSQCGFKIAIDNYGPELNTLAMLENTKIDYVKLDKDFVNKAKDNDFSRDVINMLMSYCDRTGTKLIAEGIENDNVLRFVRNLGITLGQGYYFGKPDAPSAYENL